MRRVCTKASTGQMGPSASAEGQDQSAVTVAMIQALIPLGLRAVEEALQADVAALGRAARLGVFRRSEVADRGARVRDRAVGAEIPLATYAALQTSWGHDVGLFRRVLGGLSCREYEAAAGAVPRRSGWPARACRGGSSGRVRARSSGSRSGGSMTPSGWCWCSTAWRSPAISSWSPWASPPPGHRDQEFLIGEVHRGAQRCQWHKRENVVRHLATHEQPTWRRKLQAAHAQPTYAAAKRALTRLHHDLPLRNASAAASLAAELEETRRLHQLGVAAELSVSFKITNLIESVMAHLEAKAHRVTRWRTSDQKFRWCAAALGTMERKFRWVKGYRHLPLLKQALTVKLVSSPAAAA